MQHKLFTKAIQAKLEKNARENPNGDKAYKPVVKVFTPDANATWLFTELDAEGLLFGLCDLGLGMPELGYVSLAELLGLRGPMGLKVERDAWFEANKTLVEYAEEARAKERIVA